MWWNIGKYGIWAAKNETFIEQVCYENTTDKSNEAIHLELSTHTYGHGVQGQICHNLTPASYESLPAPSGHRFPHFGYIHWVGGALILDRCRAFDLFASVDAHLWQTEGKNLAWLGEIERKLAKLSMTVLPLYYFMVCATNRQNYSPCQYAINPTLNVSPGHYSTYLILLGPYQPSPRRP